MNYTMHFLPCDHKATFAINDPVLIEQLEKNPNLLTKSQKDCPVCNDPVLSSFPSIEFKNNIAPSNDTILNEPRNFKNYMHEITSQITIFINERAINIIIYITLLLILGVILFLLSSPVK